MYIVCIFHGIFLISVMPDSNDIMNNVGVGFVFSGCLT